MRTQAAIEQQMRQTDQRIEQGADLVTHVGEKVGFGTVGGFCCQLGLLQDLLLLLQVELGRALQRLADLSRSAPDPSLNRSPLE